MPNDMQNAISPKSDQQNADDFITGPRTITITRVVVNQNADMQPVSIFFNGDDGKPWKPCKSMCKAMVKCWGADSKQYVGRSLTLFNDPSVTFGGVNVGGIRISHASHIDKEIRMPLTASRSKRVMYVVKKLEVAAPQYIDASQIDLIQGLIDSSKADIIEICRYYKIDSLAKMTAEIFEDAKNRLQSKINNQKADEE